MKSVLVVGGGYFGMFVAEHLARQGCRVVLLEKNPDFMQRASFVNQARVHCGYHYPRSILTALRSRISFPRFVEDFHSCIYDEFEQYYLVGRVLGKITARQFQQFCGRIGAFCEPAPSKITRLVNPDLVEAVYLTREYAFDAVKLKKCMIERLHDAKVSYQLQCLVQRVRPLPNGRLATDVRFGDGSESAMGAFDHVFVCTYSMINALTIGSGTELIPLKHEMTELCLISVPQELEDRGITVMCGPFFSCMPFPAGRCHSFSHVRYTPHYEWMDSEPGAYVDAHEHCDRVVNRSAWRAMQRDAARYMPLFAETIYLQSLWEVKTILPRSESDDSRPILFRPNHGMKGLHCIMGGKIDNVYDAVAEIDRVNLLSQC